MEMEEGALQDNFRRAAPSRFDRRQDERLNMLTRFQRLLLVFVLFSFSVGCDQVTKIFAKDHLSASPAQYFGGFFRFQYAENSGGFLSFGATFPTGFRFWAFIIFTGLALAAMSFFLATARKLHWIYVVALSLVIGGGIGNLIDRICNHGAVVDFMNVGVGNLRTGIFNVADVAILAGAGLLLLRAFQPRKPQSDAPRLSQT